MQIIMDNDMLSPGGMIAADNTLGFGIPYTPKEELRRLSEDNERMMSMGNAIKNFNEFVFKDERVNQVCYISFYFDICKAK